MQAERAQAEDARRLAEVKRRELETAHEQLRGQVQKTHALETNLAKSESRRSELERQSSELEKRWSDLERSLGWLLLQKARRVRSSVFREGTLPGRSWSLLSRFIKTARRSGIRACDRQDAGKNRPKARPPPKQQPSKGKPLAIAGLFAARRARTIS